ncbi:maleylpyruvate isomerase family mycothiol-dependent enzyme [Asanoa sp. WMMD1127]|uniref:maleylpyruvate isomerase family mycothiol-dependent enzyme n=1 Tax=Asanoa sp. WMMD1127 TaxID=3016107 RepID=UPI00241807D7|nr:maleylpyruvate isomerase family mycothiol-dependent enzyme [Asanoa sp. WMMD1127]MDG4826903.1 maleylpyruvate isomerase family mycothiol-dependent enzyme [Asanoa sp. WMMD1127]
MSTDPLVLMTEVDRATERLIATAAGFDDADVAAPSALPGWTRGHVLAHVARNADGMRNLLIWARTGVVTPQYQPGQREADIAAHADRPAAEQLADLRASAAAYAEAADALTPQQWSTILDVPGRPQAAAFGVWRRLREVEVHHVDLAAGYSTDDWAGWFGHRLLHEVVSGLDGTTPLVLTPTDAGHPLQVGAGGPVVSGSACALAAWLTGRSTGAGLTVTPDGPLPTPPVWM